MSVNDTPIMFQFHKGAIKSRLAIEYPSPQSRFNSIKVRLKASSFMQFHPIYIRFQFHKGAIKRQNRLSLSDARFVSIP